MPALDLLSAVINVSTATTTTLVASVTGKRIQVYAILIQSAGIQNVVFRDSTPTTLWPSTDLTARERLFLPLVADANYPYMITAVGTSFQVVTIAAVPVSGRVYYSIEI